jgi:hypothetical protein
MTSACQTRYTASVIRLVREAEMIRPRTFSLRTAQSDRLLDSNDSEAAQGPVNVVSVGARLPRNRRVSMRNLPTDLLRTFVTVADLSGFTAAGAALGRSQPAVSL